MIERTALIFNIQKYNMYDGPGVRTLVFFKGCPLRCKWCSNPESRPRPYQVLYKKSNCTLCGACVPACPVGIHKLSPGGKEHIVDRAVECIGCRKCEEACPSSALAIAGEEKTISELLEVIEEDRPFYETSGGGVTLGGGEVLMQPEAAVNLLMACRQRGINTAIETCGYAKPETVLRAAEFTDLFLFDVKHMDSELHHSMTGVRNESILANLRLLLENRHNVRIRVPLVKGFNDDDGCVMALTRFLAPYREQKNFKGIDLLPYHKLGVYKYAQLDLEYLMSGDPVPTNADLARIERVMKEHNFSPAVIRH